MGLLVTGHPQCILVEEKLMLVPDSYVLLDARSKMFD